MITPVVLELNPRVGAEHQVWVVALRDGEELLDVDTLVAPTVNPAPVWTFRVFVRGEVDGGVRIPTGLADGFGLGSFRNLVVL